MKVVPSDFGSIFPNWPWIQRTSQSTNTLLYPLFFPALFFFCATAINNRQKPTLSLLLQLKSQRLHSYGLMQVGQGRDKRKCHLISFRQSSSTSFSPARIFCYTYNNNMGYVSIRAWVGIGIACHRKKTGVKGITNSARELNLERISGSLFCFLTVLHFFSFNIESNTFFLHLYIQKMT